MFYDLYYLKHCSLALDLYSQIRTVKVILLGEQRVCHPEIEPVPQKPDKSTPDYSKEAA
jgi:hypothetical protein